MKSSVYNCKTLPPLQHTLPSLLFDMYAELVRGIGTFSDYSDWQLEGKAFSTSVLSRGPDWSNSWARKTARGVCTGGKEKEKALAAAEKPIPEWWKSEPEELMVSIPNMEWRPESPADLWHRKHLLTAGAGELHLSLRFKWDSLSPLPRAISYG